MNKTFLVPAFVLVEAADADAAIEQVSVLQTSVRPIAPQARLFQDEAIPVSEVPDAANTEVHSILDVVDSAGLVKPVSDDLDLVRYALTAFLDNERDKGAQDGLASEIAETLLSRIEKGGDLGNLSPVQRSLLDYLVELELLAQDCRESNASTDANGN